MDQHPGPRDLQTPEDLKWTPNTAMEMRFGRRGESRPHRSEVPKADEPKPVNHVWARSKTEIVFGGLFAAVAVAMVAGMLYVFGVFTSSGEETHVAEAPAVEEPAAEEPSRELQGGVEVRKGFGGK